MFVPFDTLPDEARIWVYQAERPLTSEEENFVLSNGKKFMDQWVSHGHPLTASIKVIERSFVLIAVDDRQLPSGCSIDASVGLLRSLGSKLKVDFFSRTNIPLWINQSVKLFALGDLKKKIKKGEVSEDTLMFNTLVQKKKELAGWIIPLKESWLARYLPETAP